MKSFFSQWSNEFLTIAAFTSILLLMSNAANDRNAEIAATIASQIGGHRAFVMMGAKNRAYGERYLTWKIGRNAKRVTHIRVTLAGDDTYTVEFLRVCGLNVAKPAEFSGVYADSLKGLIEENTGLYLSL